jgi:hypothetical protein
MMQKPSDVSGSGIDKAPCKTLAEKIADTLTEIAKRSERAGNNSGDTRAKRESSD